jgi:hypothetical protein
MNAASDGNENLVFYLISMGADTTLTNKVKFEKFKLSQKYEETALQIAEQKKRPAVVGLLKALQTQKENHDQISGIFRPFVF